MKCTRAVQEPLAVAAALLLSAFCNTEEIAAQSSTSLCEAVEAEEVGVADVDTSAREVIDPVDEAAGTTSTDVRVTMLLEMIFPDGSLVTS